MKIILTGCVVLFLIQFLTAQTDEKVTLIVIISNLENNQGEVHLKLADSRNNYESSDETYKSFNLKVEEKRVELIIDDLPYGEYAIKLYHDEDLNGELNTNFLGMPTEDYGFSNNARGTFGPADYDDAKFIFEQSEMTMEISAD